VPDHEAGVRHLTPSRSPNLESGISPWKVFDKRNYDPQEGDPDHHEDQVHLCRVRAHHRETAETRALDVRKAIAAEGPAEVRTPMSTLCTVSRTRSGLLAQSVRDRSALS
jgi:hypothetical protein